jgi:hypothetical protein
MKEVFFMTEEHKAGRRVLRGATVAIGGIALAGMGAGMANASTMSGYDHGQPNATTQAGDSYTGPSSSLVDLSHNNVPIQACHNQVPVNVLGVQVPVQDVTGALGLGVLGSAGTAPAATDSSCNLGGLQQN